VVLGGALVVGRVLLRVDAIYGQAAFFGPMQGSAITYAIAISPITI